MKTTDYLLPTTYYLLLTAYYLLLTTHKVDQLEKLFKECDVNGDGVVDFEEFRRVMDLLSVQVRGRGRGRGGGVG